VRKAAIQIFRESDVVMIACSSRILLTTGPGYSWQLCSFCWTASRKSRSIFMISKETKLYRRCLVVQSTLCRASAQNVVDGFLNSFERPNPNFNGFRCWQNDMVRANFDDWSWRTMTFPNYMEDADWKLWA